MAATGRHPRNAESRIAMHRTYWSRKPQAHPLAAFRVVEDFFFARHYEAAGPLLVPGQTTTANMLVVDDFVADYERMFAETEELGQDAFWTAEPYTAIPWMEAILGCEIKAAEASFTSEHWMTSLEQIDEIRFDPANPWLLKYLEFTEKLVQVSRGRFPVGMPIMRGPSDMVGALMGQTEMVFAIADSPEEMKRFFLKVTDVFLRVIAEQKKIAGQFLGGESMGFYHVYCPGSCMWFQEDLSALLSPAAYREFLSAPARRICRDYQHTAIHLHPTSFFILDELLAIDELRAIEVNKDVGGPSVAEMIPTLNRIAQSKNLILWGDFTPEDLDAIRTGLPSRGLFLHVIASSMEMATELLQQIRTWNG